MFSLVAMKTNQKLKGGKESPIQLIKSPSSLLFLSTPQRPHPGRLWLLLAHFSTPALFSAIGTPVLKQKAGMPLCGDVLLHLMSWETEEGSGMPVSSWVDARWELSHCAAQNCPIPHRWPPLRLLSCEVVSNPLDCSPPGSSVHGISQARTLEWVATPFSRGSS